MFKYGLKLGIRDIYFLKEVQSLFEKGYYSYVEVYIIPDSFNDYLSYWKKLNIPLILHAPHAKHGLNLAISENTETNKKLINETLKIADNLDVNIVIVHPGHSGNEEEVIKQLNSYKDKRLVVENKPFCSIVPGIICNGSTISQIKFILNETNLGFCLDINHAICTSNKLAVDSVKYLQEFNQLKPVIYHLADGNKNSITDIHLHLGKGSYNISGIINLIPKNSLLTIETEKESRDNLNSFIEDIQYLKGIINEY